jgi:hypothetical protein
MTSLPIFGCRLGSGHTAVLALLVVLALTCYPNPLIAAQADNAAVLASDASSSTLFAAGWVNDIMGNRTRMIQIACVFVVVGALLLRQKYRE